SEEPRSSGSSSPAGRGNVVAARWSSSNFVNVRRAVARSLATTAVARFTRSAATGRVKRGTLARSLAEELFAASLGPPASGGPATRGRNARPKTTHAIPSHRMRGRLAARAPRGALPFEPIAERGPRNPELSRRRAHVAALTCDDRASLLGGDRGSQGSGGYVE